MFDYGLLLHADPLPWLRLEMQGHGLHHGGQLYSAGEPVVNNQVLALGGQIHGRLPLAGASSLRVFQLLSHGDIDSLPAGRPDHGHGTYIRAAFTPGNWLELFAIQWWGRDFVSNEGDANYNSQGSDPAFYHSYRKYQEIGLARRDADRGRAHARHRVSIPSHRRPPQHRDRHLAVGVLLPRDGARAVQHAAPAARGAAAGERADSRRRSGSETSTLSEAGGHSPDAVPDAESP